MRIFILIDEQSGKERHFRFDQVDTLAHVARDPSLYAKPGARLYLARSLANQQAGDEDLLGTDMKSVWDSESVPSLPAKLKALRPAAQAGGLRALLRWRYLCRLAKDADCASEWLDMVLPMAEEHEAYPTVLLALAYGEGQGVAKDTNAAMKLLADADATWGPGEATVAYARLWLDDGERDFPPELVARLNLARAAGNPASDVLLARTRVYDDEHPALAPDELQALTAQAEKGLPSAMKLLADYFRGQKDTASMLVWLRRSADAGDPDAQSSLASYLNFGEGVAQDKDAALVWMQRAADGGDEYALRFLGNRRRSAGDWVGAEAHYAACAYANDADCAYNLADLYLAGHPGLQGDVQAGVTLLRELDANADSAQARRRLAGLLVEGKAVKQDLLQARQLLEKDAERGETTSQLALGHALADGLLGARDEAGGVAWMQRAADAGDRYAAGELGYWLYYKKATAEARLKALAIWRKSVQTGNDLSQNNLAWALCTSADPAVFEPQEGLKVAIAMGDPAKLDVGAADTVASCYAAAGQFERAAEVQQQLLAAVAKAKDGDTDPADATNFRARLAQYQRHERYVEPLPTPPAAAPAPAP